MAMELNIEKAASQAVEINSIFGRMGEAFDSIKATLDQVEDSSIKEKLYEAMKKAQDLVNNEAYDKFDKTQKILAEEIPEFDAAIKRIEVSAVNDHASSGEIKGIDLGGLV